MRKIYGLLVLLLFVVFKANATHLVGGDLAMKSVSAVEYVISLNLYFDEVSGSVDAEDQQVMISAFSKRTNTRIEVFSLNKKGSEPLVYSNPECKQGSLRTRVIRYEGKFVLSPELYSEPDGYYLSWERCCRNGGISNITQPGNTGMVFYMEFPAVALPNGNAFINSSPVLNAPLSDYLCRGELYTYNFSATDADNDSLVYKLSTPLAGHTTANNPFPQNLPAPYTAVNWASGYSSLQMINGNPPLSINAQTGEITVAPSFLGLFVFGIVCEEYRNGMKIGEVRREMQIKVLNCTPNSAPQIALSQPNSNNSYVPGDTIYITGKIDYCMNIELTDPDRGQNLSLESIPVNFVGAPPVFSVTTTQGTAGGTIIAGTLCWADCGLATDQEVFLVNLVVKDNGCSVPKSDTLAVIFKVTPEPNAKPVIQTNLPGNAAVVQTGSQVSFTVTGTDADADQLTLTGIGAGFDLAAAGMEFTPASMRAGEVISTFTWTPDCNDFSRQQYDILFTVKDNSCYAGNIDTISVRLTVAQVEAKTEQFLPPNVFTPNNDQINDFFEMPNLPKDNCSDSFEELAVYNRWGKLVYESAERNFKWDGKNVSDGVYFYVIRFKNSTYRGTVTIMQ